MLNTVDFIHNESLVEKFIENVKRKNEEFIKNKPARIIGWCNTYIPEEIILASGAVPYRVMGAPIPLTLSKTYLSGNLCANIQSLLECALRGDYKFLDGIVIGASTDSTKRLFDAWIRYAGTPFNHLFDVPKFIYDGVYTHYRESLKALIEDIEKQFGSKITDSSLKEAIAICNKTRALLTNLNNLRKKDVPPISSKNMLEICKLAMLSFDKKFFNKALESLLANLRISEGKESSFRILLTGSFQDQPGLLEAIEENNALVVCEDLCTRLRYFSGLIDENMDPILAIMERYIEKKPPSATLVSFDQRTEYLSNLLSEFRIDAVVYHILKFDDAYLFEFPDMREFFETKAVPVLRIETEYNTSAVGQVRTRLQAFMETLKIIKSRKAKVLNG